jgi:hypothetical protein
MLWGSKDGTLYKQVVVLSRLLKELLKEALITALFNMGLKEQEVNAYTGHSSNAHTALTNYFYLDESWVGRSLLGAAAEAQVSEPVARLIERAAD